MVWGPPEEPAQGHVVERCMCVYTHVCGHSVHVCVLVLNVQRSEMRRETEALNSGHHSWSLALSSFLSAGICSLQGEKAEKPCGTSLPPATCHLLPFLDLSLRDMLRPLLTQCSPFPSKHLTQAKKWGRGRSP
jgi:hypothetical protein